MSCPDRSATSTLTPAKTVSTPVPNSASQREIASATIGASSELLSEFAEPRGLADAATIKGAATTNVPDWTKLTPFESVALILYVWVPARNLRWHSYIDLAVRSLDGRHRMAVDSQGLRRDAVLAEAVQLF